MAESDVNTKPTEAMSVNAERGLRLRKEHNRGGTMVGVTRANQLKVRERLSPSTVRRMHSYFSRHEVDKRAQGFRRGEKGFPSAGLIAWLLWGGDAGQRWAKAKAAELDSERKSKIRKDVFTTEYEANSRAIIIGCVGSHSHDEDGNKVYMPCKTHEEYTELTGNEVSYYDIGKPKKPKKPKKTLTRKEYVDALIGIIEEMTPLPRKHRTDVRPIRYNPYENFEYVSSDIISFKAKISEAVKNGLAKKVKDHNDKHGSKKGKRVTQRMLEAVFIRGVGAYNTNPSSVRPSVSNSDQWAYARVNGFLSAVSSGRFKRGKYDTDLLPKDHPLSSRD